MVGVTLFVPETGGLKSIFSALGEDARAGDADQHSSNEGKS